MKKFQKLVGMAALSAAVLTSCVKNEESDGVKALREAQAGLIDAQAEGLLADAQLTVAQIEETVNAMKIANTKAGYLAQKDSIGILIEKAKAAIEEAKVASAKAKSEKEIAEYQATIALEQNNLANYVRAEELAVLKQEIDKVAKEQAMEQAMADLANKKIELETAAAQALSKAENEKYTILSGYLGNYSTILGVITGLNSNINAKELEIAYKMSMVDNEALIADQQRIIATQQSTKKNEEITYNNLLALQAAFKSAVADPSTAAAQLVTVETDLEKVKVAITEKEIEVASATQVETDAKEVSDDATAQTKYVNDQIAALMDVTKTDVAIEVKDPVTTQEKEIFSIYYYDHNIAVKTQEKSASSVAITEYNKDITYWTQLKTVLEGQLPTLKSTYESALSLYNTTRLNYGYGEDLDDNIFASLLMLNGAVSDYNQAQADYEAAVVAYEADPTNTDLEAAMNEAKVVRNDALAARDEAQDVYDIITDYKTTYDNYIDAIDDISDYAQKIANNKAFISTENKKIDDATADITKFTADKTTATTQLTALRNSLAGVQAKEKTALEAYLAASYELKMIKDEKAVLTTQETNLTTLKVSLESIKNSITTNLTGFETNIAASLVKIQACDDAIIDANKKIEKLQSEETKDAAKVAAEVAALKVEVAALKTQLTANQAELSRYAALIQAMN